MLGCVVDVMSDSSTAPDAADADARFDRLRRRLDDGDGKDAANSSPPLVWSPPVSFTRSPNRRNKFLRAAERSPPETVLLLDRVGIGEGGESMVKSTGSPVSFDMAIIRAAALFERFSPNPRCISWSEGVMGVAGTDPGKALGGGVKVDIMDGSPGGIPRRDGTGERTGGGVGVGREKEDVKEPPCMSLGTEASSGDDSSPAAR